MCNIELLASTYSQLIVEPAVIIVANFRRPTVYACPAVEQWLDCKMSTSLKLQALGAVVASATGKNGHLLSVIVILIIYRSLLCKQRFSDRRQRGDS